MEPITEPEANEEDLYIYNIDYDMTDNLRSLARRYGMSKEDMGFSDNIRPDTLLEDMDEGTAEEKAAASTLALRATLILLNIMRHASGIPSFALIEPNKWRLGEMIGNKREKNNFGNPQQISSQISDPLVRDNAVSQHAAPGHAFRQLCYGTNIYWVLQNMFYFDPELTEIEDELKRPAILKRLLKSKEHAKGKEILEFVDKNIQVHVPVSE